MVEVNAGLALISEFPRGIVDSSTCFRSSRLFAVLWRSEGSEEKICRGDGFVVVRFGYMHIVSCYISPNVQTFMYLIFLDRLSSAVDSLIDQLLIGGDFNARSYLWGSSVTN